MLVNVKNASYVVNKIGLPSNYVKNSQLLNHKDSVVVDKKSINKSKVLNEACVKVMKKFEGIHVNLLSFDYLEYNFFLSNALRGFSKCVEQIKQHNEVFFNS